MNIDKINVVVERKTHKRLKVLGAKDESFNSIINRLLDSYEAKQEEK